MDVKMEKVREFAASERAYLPPKEVKPDDTSDIQDLDEIKLHEMREVSEESSVTPRTTRVTSFFPPLDSVLQSVRFE